MGDGQGYTASWPCTAADVQRTSYQFIANHISVTRRADLHWPDGASTCVLPRPALSARGVGPRRRDRRVGVVELFGAGVDMTQGLEASFSVAREQFLRGPEIFLNLHEGRRFRGHESTRVRLR